MKKITISFLAMLLILTSTFAQKHQHKNPEIHKAARAYMKDNVLPVLKEQRQKLNAELSNSEQQALTQIRTELAALRKNGKAIRPEMKAKRKAGEAPSQADKDARRDHAKAQRLLMNRAWAIADAHETSIYRLIDELAPRQQTWRDDLQKLREDMKGDMPPPPAEDQQHNAKPGSDGQHHGHMKGHHGGRRHGKMGPLSKLSKPVFFLLWDGEKMPGKDGIEKGGRKGGDKANRVVIAPNPASDQHEIRFVSQNAGSISITLLDYTGKPLKQVYQGKIVQGQNVLTLSVQNLEAGLYFYQMEGPDGDKAVRFFVK
ncbi:MAG: T9SS type A sorting domain-containing protein [Bacteroidia bacterium]